MHYIIFDLELNSRVFKSRIPNEIIEIGAVKLDEELQVIGQFHSFVRPKVFRKLFPLIRKKTGIKQAEIDTADGFKDVLASFRQWIGNDYVLCSWGYDDIHHLKANCKFNRRGTDWLKRNMDIQREVSKLYQLPQGQRFSLKNALEHLNIPIIGRLHRADNDAEHTAKIFISVFDSLDFSL
jgi:inhibitor of KinA sporulation pathway (predicted exonuclease)